MQHPAEPDTHEPWAVARQSGSQQRGRVGRSWSVLLVVVAAITLVVLPVALAEWPREVARWHAAAAQEFYLEGELGAAGSRLDQALEWNPSDPELYVARAKLKLELRDWQGGLEDCDRARELLQPNSLLTAMRVQFLQHLDRHEEAIAECRALLPSQGSRLPPSVRAQLLNTFAYSTAVGNLHLREGLAAAEEALSIVANVAALRDPAGVLCLGRAVTARQRGDKDVALTSITQARDHAQRTFNEITAQAKVQSDQPSRQTLALRDEVQELRAHLAGILKLRIEIAQELGRPDEVARDQLRLQELSVDGNRATVEPYGLETAVARVVECAQILDTRGYVHYRAGQLDSARFDLELATAAMQQVLQAMPWLFETRKHQVTDIRLLSTDQRSMEESLAVIVYHRAMVYESLGASELASRDRQLVRGMGYEPDKHLF